MSLLYDFLARPLFFRMDPERAHHIALSFLKETPTRKLMGLSARTVIDPVELWGLTFRNRVGLAAGFDKNAVALPGWQALGFGFVEIGTVTKHEQPGNPRPRIFRCPREQALVNRMGFPNDGADRVSERLGVCRERHAFPQFPIGVNIGKSKVTPLEEAQEDYLYSFRKHYDVGDFFIVNVSSPNTPGLRELQHPDQLRPILQSLKAHDAERGGKKPLLVKIAPDLSEAQLAEMLELIEEIGVDGVVATNTTIDHSSVKILEKGGLSGKPLRERSTEIIRWISKETCGRLPIIGVGGVSKRDDFKEKLDAGASLVEIYTGFVYQGPDIVGKLLRPTR